MKHKAHFTEHYYKWQRAIGATGGWANLDTFSANIKADARMFIPPIIVSTRLGSIKFK